jgi:hypothetical protein
MEPTTSPFMVRSEAAAYLGRALGRRVTSSALGRMASDGVGPRYVMVLGRASYRAEWLDAWLEEQIKPPAPRQRSGSLPHNDGDEGKAAPAAA